MTNFIDSLNLDSQDAITLVSVVVAFLAVLVSVSSLKLARYALKISSSRDASREAVLHATRIRSIIFSNKNLPQKVLNKTRITEKKAEKFEKAYLSTLTDLNISCASFTQTGGLAEEAFAYSSVGNIFCDYLRPSYDLIEFIYKNTKRYADIILIYRLWSSRAKEQNVRLRLDESIKESKDLQKRIVSMSWDLLMKYAISMYERIARGGTTNRGYQDGLKMSLTELRGVSKELKRLIKEQRKTLRKQKSTERYFKKKIEKYVRPLGVG